MNNDQQQAPTNGNDYFDKLKERLEYVRKEIPRLQKEEKLIEQLLIVNGKIPPEGSTTKSAPIGEAQGRRSYRIHVDGWKEQIIRKTIDYLKGKEAGANVAEIFMAIKDEIEDNVPLTKQDFYLILCDEVKLGDQARIRRVMAGIYEIKNPVRHVSAEPHSDLSPALQEESARHA